MGDRDMVAISRRVLLASAALCLAAPALALARAVPRPPIARREGFAETLHGIRIADPYRWMENPADPDWRPFIEGQGAYARAMLASLPGRRALLDRIGALSAGSTMTNQIQCAGDRIFTLMRPTGSESLVLMVRDGSAGQDRLLLDPNSIAPPGTHGAIDYYWQASPDGRYVVCGTSHGGSEDTVLRVIEVESGRLLPDAIDRANFASPSWAADGSGFFYTRLAAASDPADAYKNSAGWFHRLGGDPARDVKVVGGGMQAELPMSEIDMPVLKADAGSDRLLLSLYSGVDMVPALYIASAAAAQAGRVRWTRICGRGDGVMAAAVRGEELYLLSVRNAPRGRILRTSASTPDLASAHEVVPEGPETLVAMGAARDALYVMTSRIGVNGLRALSDDGAVRTIMLPFEGAFPWGFHVHARQDGAWLVLQSWVRAQTACHVRADGGVTVTGVAAAPDVDLSPYAFTRAEVRARDGVMVPLSIIHRADAARDGSAPLIMTVYGAYGVTLEPRYTPADVAWLERGGALAIAHVRGGGDLGEDWHKAGFKASKANSWRDLIDCGRWLVANGWTSRKGLAVQGKSAGGIPVGRALTEAPGLFGAVISRVGVSNALRSHAMPSGPANAPEYGSIDDPGEFRGLYAMDAYQHVRAGVDYPAVLLTTGLEDQRVMPWQPAKMAARLQEVSERPVLLRVDEEAGHGLGLTRRQEDQEKADIFAFVLWAAGDPDFQPRAG